MKIRTHDTASSKSEDLQLHAVQGVTVIVQTGCVNMARVLFYLNIVVAVDFLPSSHLLRRYCWFLNNAHER